MSSSAHSGYITKLSDWYQRLSLRERALVTLCALSLTWMLWETTVGGFLARTEVRLSREASATYGRLERAVEEQAALQAATSRDPNRRLAAERARLEAELRTLNTSVGATLGRFVAPERMPAVLEDIIRHHQGLKLKRMISLPVEPVESASADRNQSNDAGSVQIFRHPLRLQFEGNYFDVVAYLNELEEGPWEFGWRELDYRVSDYPLAEITIEIETLSREKSWIGV